MNCWPSGQQDGDSLGNQAGPLKLKPLRQQLSDPWSVTYARPLPLSAYNAG